MEAAATKKAWRQQRLEDRRQRRSVATARVRTPIAPEVRQQDPLRHSGRNRTVELIQLAVFLVVAVGLHVVILLAFFGASSVVAAFEKRPVKKDETIEVAMITPPPPPPPAPEPPPPAPEPEVAEKPKEAPKPKAEPPPPDPIDLPKEPPKPEPTKTPPRRIVGLSLESTVGGGEGGGGPSFAVGNTRMGSTEKVAQDAKDVQELKKDPTPPPPPPPANRVASRVPSKGPDGPTLVKPKRKAPVKPTYPETLKAQNLEADVSVEVVVGTDGKVKSARIIAAAPYPEFNEAALAAAKTEEFAPATRDGEPIEFTLTFTIRFRLTD